MAYIAPTSKRRDNPMLRNKKVAALVGAALIGGTALSGAAFVNTADASSTTHTLKFVAISDRDHRAGNNGFQGTEIERSHGHVVGYDVISGIFNERAHSVKIYVAISRRGGLLFARLHSTSETTYVGTVTGGSGKFAGATGSLTAHNAPHNDDKTFVTIHYTLP
ncbi:MAG TPA: hypothetical protein VH419_05540 [Nocardioidaceae bacterium]|jgi:hypothetical protein